MPSYHVAVADASAEHPVASLNAPSLPALALRLEREGFTLRRVAAPRVDRSLRGYHRRVSEAEVTTFLRQLSVSLDGGVSLAEALGNLARETYNPTLRAIVADLERAVRSGDTLSSALSTYPRLFSPIYLRLLEAGEAGHRVPEVLRDLANYAERASQARTRIRTSLVYPQVVGVFTLGVIGAAFLVVVPQFLRLFRDLGLRDDQLPFATRALMWASTWLLPLLLVGVPLGALLFFGWVRRAERTAPFELAEWKTRLPVVGALYHQFALLRLTRLLAALLCGGVPLLEALRLAGQGAESPLLQAAMWDAIPHVAAGETLSKAFSHAGILPPSFCGQIAAAESGGDLPGALRRLADWYSERVDYLAARVGAVLEPIVILFLAFLAGWVAMGVFAPLVAMIQGLSGGQ